MLVVSCLCAEWCHTCVEDRPGFLALGHFPTIRVTRGDEVLFHGTMLPIHAQLERLLKELFSRPGK